MSDLACTSKGLEQPITVGKVFEFNCKGEFPLNLQVDQVQVAGIEDKYAIKVLKFELRDPATADIQMTSYRVGQQKFETLQISDGVHTFNLPGINFEVVSVLPPPEGMTEPVKPFGPFGPMQISVPWVYWTIIISILGIVLMLAAWSWKKRRNRIEILREIKKRTTGPTPVVQFHRDLRILTKKAGVLDRQDQLLIPAQEYLKELRQIGETFWGQKFNMALLGQSADRLEPEFKSQAPKVYVKYKDEIKFWNKRWQRLFATSQKAQMKDLVDMTFETRSLIEKMVEEER